jgi:hypothetical protein
MTSDEITDLRCRKCRPPRISTPGILWMAGPRMRALLKRLSEAENDVDGSLPWWVSFKWIATWCSSDGSPVVDDRRLMAAYRQLLDSFLAGSFRTSRVLYLGDPTSARWSQPPGLSNADSIAGYRMMAQFLEARTKVYSLTDPDESWVLFNLYLAPCWTRRSAAARWLENNRYSLPSQWMASSGSADGSSREQLTAVRATPSPSNYKRPREAPMLERVIRNMRRDIDDGKRTIEWLLGQKKTVLALEYDTSETTAYDASRELARRLASRSQSRDQERPITNSD